MSTSDRWVDTRNKNLGKKWVKTLSFGWVTNPLEKFSCYLCWKVFHSAKSHITVVQWPMEAPIKWTQETPLMCSHLEWFQMTEKMRGLFSRSSGFNTGQWGQPSENMTQNPHSIYMKAVEHMYEMQLWPVLRNKLTQMHFSPFFCIHYVEIDWMNDSVRPIKKGLWYSARVNHYPANSQTTALSSHSACPAKVCMAASWPWQPCRLPTQAVTTEKKEKGKSTCPNTLRNYEKFPVHSTLVFCFCWSILFVSFRFFFI